ncbi:sulfoquinovosidase-like [Styela clava]
MKYHCFITIILFMTKQIICAEEECTVDSQSGSARFRLIYDEVAQTLTLNLVDQAPMHTPKQELLLSHTPSNTAVHIGNGKTGITEYRGNFNITDYTSAKIALSYFTVSTSGLISPGTCESVTFRNIGGTPDADTPGLVEAKLTLTNASDADGLSLMIGNWTAGYDRIWLRFVSIANEKIYGGGEQFSFFNMKGKSFPIWTREQGVGRNKATNMTFLADSQDGGAGGDYHTTYWPEPLFYTDKLYSAVMTSSKYSVFDFTQDDFSEVEVWEDKEFQFDFHIGKDWKDITMRTADYLLGGLTRPTLAPWSYNGGAVLGLQGGTDTVMGIYDQAIRNDVKVSGIWIQDWVGQITTSFGTRLFWDWKLDETRYPNIRQIMQDKAKEGVYFTAYINPYLNDKGELYENASDLGYLVKSKDGDNHVSDFGEFFCGTVDLTNPDAFNWYKNVIKTNLIDVGFRGWMADFGEYLPVDGQIFHDGRSAEELHNLWPSLWAEVNRAAVDESNMDGEFFIWMRAGHTASAKYTMSAWAGDQNVDWSIDDGLVSTIPAALSLGMSGVGISHFDIGGFTSLYGVVRSQELLLRSAESAVFTPNMRTHEGNRPKENWQIYDDDYTFQRFGRLTKLHTSLANYTRDLIQEYYDTSTPVQRPLFFEFPEDTNCYDDLISKDQYMYGPDLLVAPIYTEGKYARDVYFPTGAVWIDIWDSDNTTDTSAGGYLGQVSSNMGEPPVYYREGSKYAEIFKAFETMPAKPYPPNSGIQTTATLITILLSVIMSLYNFH